MRLGFVTCVQLGLSCMEAIYKAGGALSLAVTLPDDKAVNKSGRVYLDAFCAERDVPLFKTPHINDLKVIQEIRSANLDWLFVIGWSQIASLDVLSATNKGVFGMHPTLLPEGRGRASIPWAILKGLEKTGVTLFKMDAGVDTGQIAAQLEIPLEDNITATVLYEKVDAAHVGLIEYVIPLIMANNLCLIDQDEAKATVWPGRKPEDGRIDLDGSVHDAEKLVRAVTRPYPGAFYFMNGKKHIIWAAKILLDKSSCPSHAVCLEFFDGLLLIEESELIELNYD